ncbi:MAG TPA: hypothetical protein DC046_12350 [Rhodospirillaceae bacterium]|nr:hypothetical protein [Rhodospirillaceae bacterium]
MPIINKLFAGYESLGFTVSSGLNPHHHGGNLGAPFTWLLKDGRSFSNGLGISMKEIYFLECLFEEFRPRNAFVIGNSFGWSTLAIGLLNPDARVLAIDAGFDENSLEGLDVTNRLGGALGLNVVAVQAVSPEGVDGAVTEHLSSPIDFCFIDGLHTNEQVFKDFAALKPHMSDDGVFLFHDVISCDLAPGIARIAEACGKAPEVLYGTSSGMAILCLGNDRTLARTLATFRGDTGAINLIRRQQRPKVHRLLSRWRRSIAKRIG